VDRIIDLVYRRGFEYAELQGGWVALFWGLWLIVAKARAFNCVYLFPDLSGAGDAQYARCGPSQDTVIRQFYVGSTRARVKLYICQSSGAGRISL